MVRAVGEMVRQDSSRGGTCARSCGSSNPAPQARLPLPFRAQVAEPGKVAYDAARHVGLCCTREDPTHATYCRCRRLVADVTSISTSAQRFITLLPKRTQLFCVPFFMQPVTMRRGKLGGQYLSDLLATKPIDQLLAESRDESESGLRRVLGPVNLVTLGIGAIIGAGIFVLTGTVAATFTGPAIVISFILAATGCIFAGLCYAEFASLIPIAGSAYTYGYATLGEVFAWIIGWDLIIEYALGAVTVSIGWSGYVVSFLHDVGINIPPQLSAARGTLIPLADGTKVAAIFNLPAV